MERNEILKIYGTDYKENTRRLLEQADLASEIPSAGSRIGIKPNLVAATPASHGATTHPEIVDGLLSYLKENGFEQIQIMEGSWVGEKTMNAARANGILDVCQKHQIEFVDLQKDQTIICAL